MKGNNIPAAIICAILAAALYAINVPTSKLLLENVEPTMLAGFLYLGAGVGIGLLMLARKVLGRESRDEKLGRSDLKYTVAMVLLDIAAPIFLMYGISLTSSANVSLLGNLEIVATSLIALCVFGERISTRLWISIGAITIAGMILGFDGDASLTLDFGSVFVLLACICWGVENNCTRSISDKDPEQIVLIKGIFSGLGGIITAFILGERLPGIVPILLVMLLGFVAYGLSISLYISAQRTLGAAKTSAFYSIAPFLGVGFSFIFLGERPGWTFFVALAIMAASTVIMVRESLRG